MVFNLKELDNIEGWLFEEEAELLHDIAKRVPPNLFWCEIGSWKGKSTVAMAQSGSKGIAIDWFKGNIETANSDTMKEYFNNIKEYSMNITTLPFKSFEVVDLIKDNSIYLLFIDGEHTYEAVKRDFEMFLPKVVSKGYIVIHDIEFKGNPWHEVNTFYRDLHYDTRVVVQPPVARCGIFRKI